MRLDRSLREGGSGDKKSEQRHLCEGCQAKFLIWLQSNSEA